MKTLAISLVLLAASAAFANEAADESANRRTFAGAAARETVRAHFLAARAGGTLPPTGDAAALASPAVTDRTLSRETARREGRQAARQAAGP